MSTTTNYGWTKPTVGGDTDTWGTKLNTLIDAVDTSLNTVEDAAPKLSNNGSDFTAATFRTNVGLAIGSDVQAYDAGLASIAGLTTAADRGIYTTASDTYAVFTLTAAGRALLDDASASAQRTTLGLGTSAVVNTGTSGATVALCNGANTWGSAQSLPTGSTYNSKRMAHVNSGSATNTGLISWGTAAPGTLAEGEIYLQHD